MDAEFHILKWPALPDLRSPWKPRVENSHSFITGNLVLVQIKIACPQSHIKVLIRREDRGVPLPHVRRLARLLYDLARHRLQSRVSHGVAEEGDAIPVPVEALAVGHSHLCVRGRDGDAVDGALEEAVGPVGEHVGDVDEHRRGGIRFCPGRVDGDGGPGRVWGEDLETCLALEAEEELGFVRLCIIEVEANGAWVRERTVRLP